MIRNCHLIQSTYFSIQTGIGKIQTNFGPYFRKFRLNRTILGAVSEFSHARSDWIKKTRWAKVNGSTQKPISRPLSRPHRPSKIKKSISEQIQTEFQGIVRIRTISENSDQSRWLNESLHNSHFIKIVKLNPVGQSQSSTTWLRLVLISL